jgi:uncharacterized protein
VNVAVYGPPVEDLAPLNHDNRPVPGRVNVVTLGVRDFPRMKAFYDELGWRTRSTGDDFAAYPLGGAVLALYPVELLAEDAGRPAPQAADAFRGFSVAINVEDREQVDEVLGAAAKAGAELPTPAEDKEWGGRSGYFFDPEGNAWEVAWLPNLQFDERGGLFWPF